MRRSLLLLVLVLLVAGCSRRSFVGKGYDNFSAYYNTFYNAEKAYEAGVQSLEQSGQNQPLDPGVYLPIFGEEGRPAQARLFDDAIKKSADVLREHPESKWVDDALLLIGKSYFYLQNYVGAEQKFREIMEIGSPLEDEARLWLARTLIAGQQFEQAADHLEESLLREDLSERWAPMLRLAQGELQVRRQNWDAAAEALAAGLDGVGNKERAARAEFLLGQVYETLGRYADAVASYQRVSEYNPFYELDYAAQVSAIRVEGEHGEAEDALRWLRRMERDDKHYENRAELAYLRGRLFQAMGRPDDALETYDRLLYDADEGLNIAPVRGRTHYALGELFRDAYLDYATAAAHFDTAASALPDPARSRSTSGAAEVVSAPAAITDGQEMARTFGSFAAVMSQIAHYDSLLYLGRLDEDAFEEKVLALRQQRADELEAQRIAQERREAEQRFGSGTFDPRDERRNSRQSAASSSNSTAGFLFHKDPIRVQEGIAGFQERWGDRPLVPNWRRLEAVSGVGATASEGPGQIVAGPAPNLPAAGLPEIDLTTVPRDPESQRLMEADRAAVRYELGNVLFLQMNRPDSAAAWYRLVIEEDGDEPVAQRAYYALAEVQRALGDTLAAERLYRTIVEAYPQSDFAGQARTRLGLPVAVASDSLALAEQAYADAYRAWQRGVFEPALNDMLAVASRYRTTPVGPRALLAAGSIYMEWAARDSLSLFDELPLAVPDSLLLAAGLMKLPAPPAAPVDTLAASADTLAASADTLVVPADTLAAPADTLVVPDDTLVAPSDTLVVPADSLVAEEPAPAARPDTVAAVPAEPEPVRLETLYASLLERYPQSPQAGPARRVLSALEQRRAALETPAEPLDEEAPADTLAVPDPAEADSVGAPRLRPEDVLSRSRERPQARRDTSRTSGRDVLRERLRQQEALIRQPQTPPADSADAEARELSPLERLRREETADERPEVPEPSEAEPTPPEDEPVPAEEEPIPAEERDTPPAEPTPEAAAPIQEPAVEEAEPVKEPAPTEEAEPLQEPAPVDSAAVAVPDSTAPELPSPEALPRDAAVPEAGEEPEADEAPGPQAAAPVEGPMAPISAAQRAAGGWTIVAATLPSTEAAEAMARSLRRQGFGVPVSVLSPLVEGGGHLVAVGWYRREKQAQVAFDVLVGVLPESATVMQISPEE